METLNQIIVRSLTGFLDYIHRKSWNGRENEAVSLYAFGFLQRERRKGSPLNDPTQIAIEVGAADTPKSPKSQVRKDLVIWREAGANRWFPETPRSEPLAIMEWKVRRPGIPRRTTTTSDIEWLSTHCPGGGGPVGYSILLDLSKDPATLTCIRVTTSGTKTLKV